MRDYKQIQSDLEASKIQNVQDLEATRREGTSEYADPLAEPGVRVIWFGFSDFRNPLKDEFNFSELDPKATTFLKGKTVTPVTSEAGAIEYLQTGNLGVFK